MNQANGDPYNHAPASSGDTYDDFNANRNFNTTNNNNDHLGSGHQRNHVGRGDSMDTDVITRLNITNTSNFSCTK